MIQLKTGITPDAITFSNLKKYQDEIDVLPSFEERSEKAKKSFKSKNINTNATFNNVKQKLTEMCSGARRCAYCEDSVGDEVEHIHPKDLYPGDCFKWENYVYACGNCNGPKNNKFAVFRNDNGKFQTVNLPHGQPSQEPPQGEDAIINPRIDNPLDFCVLDLNGTFKFVVLPGLSEKNEKKFDYTYNEVLRLNDQREFLRVARENAFVNYKSRLGYYVTEREKGKTLVQLQPLIDNLKREAHPTVWKEMQRYYLSGWLKTIDDGLHELFSKSPEALNW
ncbi:MAG: aminoglycoside phosphotransferase [Bacteroidia bacterium]